ncbi:cytochrome C oxidase assembly protein COX15 [Babesia gibsoni]|uniref:Cytochrome C oxidase assembly protein COX15 n=1 Tax=Babesia gibsoni TaxID=33632 RepID=A0AAD8PG65_BABGI|nr:cytochrome C oxidase assembly protein COX15 [Babesia gibsoni]
MMHFHIVSSRIGPYLLRHTQRWNCSSPLSYRTFQLVSINPLGSQRSPNLLIQRFKATATAPKKKGNTPKEKIESRKTDTTAKGTKTPKDKKGHQSTGYDIATSGWERAVAYWLLVMSIGAYVRLNESGLSMLDWRLLGVQLPKDDEEWHREFKRYKATPEYKKVHYGISLEDYKKIYLNEWIHRMMGRFSGLFFGGGALYLAVRGALAPGGYILTLGVLSLGLSQAFVGKWMVDSGFKEPDSDKAPPRVSPYRLSMHFANALGIYSICLWNGIKLLSHEARSSLVQSTELAKVRCCGKATLTSLFLTILYGTIVSGNDAGLAYNTWPKMMDSYIPDDYKEVSSVKDMFEKTGVIQFNHRCLGYLTTTFAALTFMAARDPAVPVVARKLAMGTLHASLLQVALGIITVLKQVPLHGAMTHHVNALAVWSVLVALLARTK